MSTDLRDALRRAAARPGAPVDVDRLYTRAHRKRTLVVTSASVAAAAVVVLAGIGVVSLVRAATPPPVVGPGTEVSDGSEATADQAELRQARVELAELRQLLVDHREQLAAAERALASGQDGAREVVQRLRVMVSEIEARIRALEERRPDGATPEGWRRLTVGAGSFAVPGEFVVERLGPDDMTCPAPGYQKMQPADDEDGVLDPRHRHLAVIAPTGFQVATSCFGAGSENFAVVATRADARSDAEMAWESVTVNGYAGERSQTFGETRIDYRFESLNLWLSFEGRQYAAGMDEQILATITRP